MKHILIFIILLMTACAEPAEIRSVKTPLSEIVICVSVELKYQDYLDTVRAANFWSQGLGLPITVERKSSTCNIEIVGLHIGEPDWTGEVPEKEYIGKATAGLPSYIELFYGRYDQPDVDPGWIIAHEIGHSFGVKHIGEGLMQSGYKWKTQLPNCLEIEIAEAVIEAGEVTVTVLQVCDPSNNG